jgi:hypothetical protein
MLPLGNGCQGRAHGERKVVVWLPLVLHRQAVGEIFQSRHQRSDMGGHGGGYLRGAQLGLVFGKGELVALLCQQLAPVEDTKQRHQYQCARDTPQPDRRVGKVRTQVRGQGRKQAGKKLHL